MQDPVRAALKEQRLVLCEEVARDGAQARTLLNAEQRLRVARGMAEVFGEGADELRRSIVGDDVTYVKKRNINYTTCAAVLALARAHGDNPQERIEKSLKKAQTFLVALQNAEDRGY